MSTGEILLEILKYVAPAGLVLGAVALFLNDQRSRKEAADRQKLQLSSVEHMVPLRLQAYERLIIYMERIAPDALVLRSEGQGKTARAFQQQMINDIRNEYSHNIAQQLYVKHDTWKEVVRAKEQVISLVNLAAKSLPAEATGLDLGKRILNEMIRTESAPTYTAVLALKTDVHAMFRF